MTAHTKHNNKVPERWEEYTNMGRQIPGTRFIAFKVPLREAIGEKATQCPVFSPRTLMDHCQRLGLIVDLTNTTRYYSSEVFKEQGIEYQKVFTEGKVVPKKDAVYRFFIVVNNFLDKNKANDNLIGVHCTHGINRTGYMVCRYMIQQLGIPPDQAIADYNSARGHEQERENYLQDLRKAEWMKEPIPASLDELTHDPRYSDKSSASARNSPRRNSAYFSNSGSYSNNSPSPSNWRRRSGGGGGRAEWASPGDYTPSVWRGRPSGPVPLGPQPGSGAGGGGTSRDGRAAFRGCYDSGAFATEKTTSGRHQDPSGGGATPRPRKGSGLPVAPGRVGSHIEAHKKGNVTRCATRHTEHATTTTAATKAELHPSTTLSSTSSSKSQGMGPSGQHTIAGTPSTTKLEPTTAPDSTGDHDPTAAPPAGSSQLQMSRHGKAENKAGQTNGGVRQKQPAQEGRKKTRGRRRRKGAHLDGGSSGPPTDRGETL